MEQIARTIRLYGGLGAKFGREHRYVVSSPREALRALGVMIPGFWPALHESAERGVRYAVFIGQRNVDETQLDLPVGNDMIRIAPVVAGSKAGGVFQTIAGVALAGAGATSMFFAPGNPFSVDAMLMGGSLALGGVAQMLSPQTPTAPAPNQHGMPGIQNVTAQGGPVPLLYGRMRVGSTVISETLRSQKARAVRATGLRAGPHERGSDPGALLQRGNDRCTRLQSRLVSTTVDLVSEGEISGLAHEQRPLRSVYLDDVPIENADGSRNFSVDQFELRRGGADQEAVSWVTAASCETAVNVELARREVEPADGEKRVVFTPWVLHVQEPDVDQLSVTLCAKSLWWDYAPRRKSDAAVQVKFTLSYFGTAAPRGEEPVERIVTINGVAHEYHETIDFPVDLSRSGYFRLDAQRVADDADDNPKRHGTVHIVSYAKHRTGRFRYPSSALAALQVNSGRFDRIPVRSYDLKGLLVEVPTNYDPGKRTCTGTWDGAFKRAWTDNPAWIFRDVLLNRRYGAGEWVQEAYVDRYGLYAIAKYCDESVPNGDGGVEPRFTCNCYITSRTHAFALLQQLASVFRGIVYWSAANVLSSADMPGDPVSVYNPSNVAEGIFKYTGSSLKTRHTACAVTWCNPLNGYKRAVETVEDAQGIALYGYNAAEITAFGCTSRTQAQRAGAWLLQTSRLETETVSFSVGLDGALALPGQVIEIADPLRSQSCLGGRIKQIDAAGRIVLDRDVRAEPGDYLTVMLPDARAHRVALSEVSGSCVRPATALPQTPVQGAAWTIQPAMGATQRFRVVSVSEVGDGTAFSITAVRHAPEKYAIIDDAATTDSIRPAPVEMPAPKNFTLSAGLTRHHEPYIDVRSEPVAGATGYTLSWYMQRAGAPAMHMDLSTPETRLSGIVAGKYTVELCAKSWDARVSAKAQAQVTAHARIYPDRLRVAWEGNRFHLRCEAAGDTRHDHEFMFMAGQTSDFSQAKMVAVNASGDCFVNAADYPHGGYAWVQVRWRRYVFHAGAHEHSEWRPPESEPGVKMDIWSRAPQEHAAQRGGC